MSKWKLDQGTIIGPLHVRNNTPNQDRYGIGEEGDQRVLVVADGAGSLPKSDEGAEIAVNAVLGIWQESVLAEDFENTVEHLETVWHDCIDAAIEAIKDQDDYKNYGSTLAVAMFSDDCWVAGTIGDSFVVVKKSDEEWIYISSAKNEFANYTELLTSSNPHRNIQLGTEGALAFAVASDGLEHSTIVQGQPHTRFWRGFLRDGSPVRAEDILTRMSELGRIDDDTTLALAIRLENNE